LDNSLLVINSRIFSHNIISLQTTDYATVETVGADFESKLEEQEKRHQQEMKQVNEKYVQIIDAMSKNPILSKVKADVLKKKIKKK
jgi:hypothetical protein